MASIIQTTAISLRKGNTEANNEFTGLVGECVADLGVDGTGTDPNTTLRLHNGVISGGIPMCRADLLNISTSQLAVGRDSIGLANEKNLAYADLSNIEITQDAGAISSIVSTLNSYGLATEEETDAKLELKANKNFSNVDTADLATGEGESGKHAGKNLAYADGTNIDTNELASSSHTVGAPLAKADTSNINTKDLTDGLIHNNTPNGNRPLMYKDLSNANGDDLYRTLFETYNDTLKIERTTNKLTSYFNPSTGQPLDPSEITADNYPTATAVTAYTQWAIENGSFMQTDLSNADSYLPLYSNNNVALNIPKDDQGHDEYTVHPSNAGPYKYIVGDQGIIANGQGFKKGHLYTNFVDISLTTIYEGAANYNQTERLKVFIEEVDANGIPTSITFWQTHGTTDISSYSPVTISDGIGHIVTIPFTVSANTPSAGIYKYNVGTISTTATTANFDTGVFDLDQDIQVNQMFWVLVEETDETAAEPVGEIVKCSFRPAVSAHYIDVSDPVIAAKFEPVLVESGITGKPGASIDFLCKTYVSNIGGAGLAKTDLSNLLGMSDDEAEKAAGTPWRAVVYSEIPSVNDATIETKQYYELASNGAVHDALVDAYTRTMGQAAGRETGGALTDVATYVKRTLDQYALSDTYRGQVLYYLANESTISNYTTRPNSTTPIQTGDQILLKQKSDILGGRPYLATATNTSNVITWTYTPFIDNSSAQSNGDYVYCLDLGTWDTENYHNVPGNITWNANSTPAKLDVAPDSYNAPDNLTIVKNPNTGAISIGQFYVPSPEFFNGNSVATSFTLSATNCPNGKVPFDVYVDGVFQYPTVSYDFTPNTRVVAFKNGFAPQTGVKNIAVIYRGIIFGTGDNAGPIDGHHT